MYALRVLFALTVLFGLRLSEACSGISEQVGEMTRDTDVFLGTAFTLNCTLTTNQVDINGTQYELNSSMIYFKFKEKRLSAPIVIDNKTALYTVRDSKYNDSGRYFCYVNVPIIEESRYVCVTKISVGIAPKLIAEDKFRCIGQEFRNFTCSWDPPYVGDVHTDYFISMYPTRSFPFAKADCAVKLNNTACQWRIDTDPPYRLSPTKFLFTVVSVNSFGDISQRFFVDHFEVVVPSPPQEFSLSSITSTSLSLTWDPPAYAEHDESVRQHIKYQLQYRPIFADDPLASNQPSFKVKDIIMDVGNALEATIRGLFPNVIYFVKIRCRIANDSSEEKWSRFTPEIKTITFEDAPFFAPQFSVGAFESTETDAVESRNVKIYWTPLSFEYFNAPGFAYEIVYYSTNSPTKTSVRSIKVQSSESSYTFENLDLNTAYTFRIYSTNVRDRSKKFSVMNVDSHKRLLDKPKDVSVFYYGNTTYEVRWNSSNHPYDEISSYSVFWCTDLHGSGCRDPLKSIIVPSSREATTINVSNRDSSYRFAVAANKNNSSSGLAWTKCVVSIVGDTLPKISEFSVEAGGNSSLIVSWGFPCTIVESVFERFEIFYCKANAETNMCETNSSSRLVVDGGRTKVAEIENLEVYTSYRVMMRGLSDRGQSEFTNFLVTKTAPGPPPPPTNFRYLSVTAHGLVLAWDLNANDTIDSFDIKIKDVTVPSGDVDMERTERLYRSQCNLTCVMYLSNRKYIESYHLYEVRLIACVKSVMSGHKLTLCSKSLTTLTVRTAVSAPSVMEKPHAEPFNKTSVRVSWKKPEPANGPIDSYNLYIFWSENKTEVVEVDGNTTSLIVSPDCFDDAMTSFRVQAFNLIDGTPEGSPLSEETVVNGCIIFESQNRGLVVGIAVGCALLLVLILFVLTSLGKYIKKKIDDLKKWSIVLPDGLKTIPDDSFAVKMKPFTRNEETEKTENIDYDSFKNRHNSGTSEMTECSTDGLLTSVQQKGHKFERTYSDQSNPETGHESVSSTSTCATHVSSDSGAMDVRHDFISFSGSDSKSQTQERKLMKSSLPSVEENQTSDSSGSRDSGLDVSSNNSAGRVLRKNKRNKTKQQSKDKTFGRPSDIMICGSSSLSNSEPSLYDYSKTYIPNEIIDRHTVEAKHAKSVANIFDHLPAEALSVHLANVSANENGSGNNGEGSPLSMFARNCYNKSFPIRDNYVTPEMMRMISTHQINEKQEKGDEVTKNEENDETLNRCDSKQSLDKDILGMERETVETSKDFSPLDLNLTDNVNVFKHENGICFETKKDLPDNNVTHDVMNYSNGVESHIDASKEDIDPIVSFVNCTPNSPHSSSSSLSSSSSSLSSTSPLTRSVPNTAPPNSGYISQQQMFNFSQKPNVEVNSDANGTSVNSQPQLIRNASGYVSFTNHQTANAMPTHTDIDSIV